MWISIAALNLALAICLGAFGAHGLKSFATPEQLAWWHTATEYFFWSALGLLALGVLSTTSNIGIKWAARLIQFGIVVFCGSLYSLALGAPLWFGAITPIGGAAMILGWLCLAKNAYQAKL